MTTFFQRHLVYLYNLPQYVASAEQHNKKTAATHNILLRKNKVPFLVISGRSHRVSIVGYGIDMKVCLHRATVTPEQKDTTQSLNRRTVFSKHFEREFKKTSTTY